MAKWILLLAAAWNILGGLSALIDPAQHFAQLYHGELSLQEPLQLFFYRCTWINVIAWGVGYALAAVLPNSRVALLAAGAAGKLMYFAACVALYVSGVGQSALVAAGVFDVLLAIGFVLILFSANGNRRPLADVR